jgi:hypothetical protein
MLCAATVECGIKLGFLPQSCSRSLSFLSALTHADDHEQRDESRFALR